LEEAKVHGRSDGEKDAEIGHVDDMRECFRVLNTLVLAASLGNETD
jgi:hypothetical protein